MDGLAYGVGFVVSVTCFPDDYLFEIDIQKVAHFNFSKNPQNGQVCVHLPCLPFRVYGLALSGITSCNALIPS